MSQNDSSNTRTPDQQVFRLLADAIQEHLPTDAIDEATVREIVATEIAEANLPRPIEVRLPDGKSNTIDGNVHHQLEEVLGLVEEGHKNVLMVGPAGSGKTTLAKNIAAALGLDFGFISLSQGVTDATHSSTASKTFATRALRQLVGKVLPPRRSNRIQND